jgi:branched-chain amino acid transport system ATP-binding protein
VALLELKDVTKTFGGLVAVNGVSMTVEKGIIFGLIGPNGAGKTTLFNLIAGYYRPDRGRVVFMEEEITGLKPYNICRKGIARTFQTTKPFLESTVVENVIVGALVHDRRVPHARKEAESIVELLELDQVAEAEGHELTVPDRKRLEVARALATGGKLLLLDEPMAGLTPTEKTHLLGILRRINERGITLIIVEHDMKAVMSICAHIVLLDRGAKLLEGNPEEVSRDPRAIAAYLGEEYGYSGN